jgi:truncated hemoglobin YjbI
MDQNEEPSVYDWAGGAEAFTRMTTIFYDRYVANDELLAPLFAHMSAEHPTNVAMWLAEVFGGPRIYSDQRGGYPEMVRHHLGKNLTEEMRARWVELLTKAANDVGLPNDPEFRSVFSAYLEWGSRIAVENSQTEATPPTAMPMPHWDWHTAAGAPGSRPSASPHTVVPEVAGETEIAPDSSTPLAPDGILSYEHDIKPLIRPSDQQGMKWAFDLWSYDDVAANADRILGRLEAGTMPPDGAWPPSAVDLFRRWIHTGMPR